MEINFIRLYHRYEHAYDKNKYQHGIYDLKHERENVFLGVWRSLSRSLIEIAIFFYFSRIKEFDDRHNFFLISSPKVNEGIEFSSISIVSKYDLKSFWMAEKLSWPLRILKSTFY